jgi:MarR family transcriptional regulator, organic hydroperoxide resistance regulator
MAASEIKFDETVSYLLAKVATAFRNALERSMGNIGLHGGQIFVLVELWQQDGLRQIDLVNRLNVTAPTVSKMLNGLEEINLIRRQKSEEDARAAVIHLTKKGYAIREQVEAQWVDLEQGALSELRETDRIILVDLLTRLRNAFTGRTDNEEE